MDGWLGFRVKAGIPYLSSEPYGRLRRVCWDLMGVRRRRVRRKRRRSRRSRNYSNRLEQAWACGPRHGSPTRV